MSYTEKAFIRFSVDSNRTMRNAKPRDLGSPARPSPAPSRYSGSTGGPRRVSPAPMKKVTGEENHSSSKSLTMTKKQVTGVDKHVSSKSVVLVKKQQVSGNDKHVSSKTVVLSKKSPSVSSSPSRTLQNVSTKYLSLKASRPQEETTRSVSQRHSAPSESVGSPRMKSVSFQNAASSHVSPPRLAAQRVSLIPVSPQSMSQRHVSTKTILTQPASATEAYKGRIPQPKSSSPSRPPPLTRASPRAMTPRHVSTKTGRGPVTDRASVAEESLKRDKDTRAPVSRNSRSARNNLNYQKISNAPLRRNVSKNLVITECYIPPANNASKRQGSPCKSNPGAAPGPTLLSPGLVSRAMRTPRHARTPRHPHMYPIKEASSSSSANELDSEEEHLAAPTPPLFNGHAIIRHPENGCNGEQVKDENLNDREPLISHETNIKEGFHSLLHAYKENTRSAKETPEPAPLSDGEDLAGVSVKQLRSSYLSVAQDTKRATPDILKTPVKPEIKAELNTSVNISSLVDTYSTSHPRPVTPSSRPDDITPVSLRSLKSAYEATASGSSCAVSRHSSSGSCSPAGGSPAPKEELNVSLQQLREEYCRSVQDGLSRSHTPSKQPLDTGVSIRQLEAVDPFPLYSLLDKHDRQVSQVSSECRQCGKQVFQMEKIVAEKAAWHKNCFRCKECNCILTLETYQSHEGVLYCKPHFKELFRPKVVVEDPDEARKERSTNKPDYGLEDLSHANLKQKFKMFEQISTEEERVPDPIPVRRSQSLLTKAARFMQSDDDYGIENSELGEYDEDEEDEDYEEDEEEDGEEGEEGEDGKLKKSRAASFSGMKDLKAGFARKNRQDELTKKRRQELAKFRQMLCAGKNISTREIFEGGNEDEKGQLRRKEQIKIEGQIDAKNLRERFEKGLSVVESDSEESGDRREVDRVFKEAETASKARNLFKQIDKTVAEGGEVVLRPASSAQARRENRLSRDGIDMEELELGRDPNLVKCTDNYEDEVDCRGTRKLLAKFKKMEKQAEIIDKEGEEDYDSDEEYSDEEYSDEEEEDSEEEDSEEEDSEEEDGKPKYKDEVLEMSAKKAASLRAKFEKWESEVERNNEYNQSIERYEDEDECMPSIDTARNLRAMFENKAQESTQPVGQRPKVKVNRFVGGGGDKCMLCDHTVYAMERLEVAGRVLHKNCFKCCKCSTKLSMNTFSIGGDDMYCTTHYKQAFTEKGTYDVFTPNKGKWTRKIEATNSESSKSQE